MLFTLTLSSLPSTAVTALSYKFSSHIHTFPFCFVTPDVSQDDLCGHRFGAVLRSPVGLLKSMAFP